MSVIEGAGSRLVTITRSFVETTGAGTYTATVPIPAGAVIQDVRWNNQALWTAATSATLNVGDALNSSGYFTAVNLKAAPVADVNNAGGISSVDSDTGAGAYAGFLNTYPSGGTITAQVVTVGGSGNAGRSTLTVQYSTVGGSGAATKV